MTAIEIGRRAAALASLALGVSLALTPPASAKSLYELRIDDAVSVQSEIAPTVFAGRPCVEVVPHGRGERARHTTAGVKDLEAGRSYWAMILFIGDHRPTDELDPAWVLRDLEGGRSVRTEAADVSGGSNGAYTTLNLRFPHPGTWSVAVVDGPRRTYELSDGRVFSTGSARSAKPLDGVGLRAASLSVPALDPGACPAIAATSGGGSQEGGSLGWPVAIAAAATVGIGAVLLRRRRRTRRSPAFRARA